MSAWLLVAVLLVYLAPGWLPDGPLAFYVLRGWLGVLLAYVLWRRSAVAWPVLLVLALFEGSTSVCGALFAAEVSAAGALCDRGTGLPLTLPVLTGALLAAVHTMRRKTDKAGSRDD